MKPQPQEKMSGVLLEDKAATRIQTAYRAFKVQQNQLFNAPKYFIFIYFASKIVLSPLNNKFMQGKSH